MVHKAARNAAFLAALIFRNNEIDRLEVAFFFAQSVTPAIKIRFTP
jgi:hypothetical protein